MCACIIAIVLVTMSLLHTKYIVAAVMATVRAFNVLKIFNKRPTLEKAKTKRIITTSSNNNSNNSSSNTNKTNNIINYT